MESYIIKLVLFLTKDHMKYLRSWDFSCGPQWNSIDGEKVNETRDTTGKTEKSQERHMSKEGHVIKKVETQWFRLSFWA